MNERQLSILLLAEVVQQWTGRYTEVEIGSDPRKIEVLQAARDVLQGGRDELPLEVLDLYNRVYLRDVWT